MAGQRLFLLLALSLLAAGCSFFAKPQPPTVAPEPPLATITVYRPKQGDDWLYPEKYSLTEQTDAARPENAITILLSEKPKEKSNVNIFPQGVKLLSLEIRDGQAQADFSKEILKAERGGSLHEMLLVSSIVNTLTEFSEITSVQLLVEGKKIDTIGGHMDVLDPLKRNEDLIKKP